MIDDGPLHDLIPKTGEEFIRLPNKGRIDVVTSNARSRLGQRVTFVPQDETGIWTQQTGMIKVAETQRRGLAGMGGRAEETTNAWDPTEKSVAQRTAESKPADIFRLHPQAPRSCRTATRRAPQDPPARLRGLPLGRPRRDRGRGRRAARGSTPARRSGSSATGAVTEAFQMFDVWRAYCDPQWIEDLVDRWQGRWGDKRVIKWFTNRPRQIAWAVRNYETAVTAGDMSHVADPDFTAQIVNARRQSLNVFDDEHRQMHTLSKDRPGSPNKIDAAMAAVLSWEARGDAIAAGALTKRPSRALVFH
jgi:hypothetical protein